ncbi:hypothetical protein ENKNEFLB_02109 [Nocardioides aquaticus]|uniref:Uncharacterized protein n=1 Tax=Nocardioides aquaticus TaxID=160826 RepID=A0ABX8EGS5_9ACTN|nr:hypothetical protein [Nocardioides aquaticus]QVT79719.1 hypothetical protein ENKNEFLB_02109 [Nocardioides aquaticus]
MTLAPSPTAPTTVPMTMTVEYARQCLAFLSLDAVIECAEHYRGDTTWAPLVADELRKRIANAGTREEREPALRALYAATS